MYDYKSIPACFLRLVVFLMIFTSYPLVHLFMTTILTKLLWREKMPSKLAEYLMNVIVCCIPLVIALFTPDIGSLLSYMGSISGFVAIYLLPVLTHIKGLPKDMPTT